MKRGARELEESPLLGFGADHKQGRRVAIRKREHLLLERLRVGAAVICRATYRLSRLLRALILSNLGEEEDEAGGEQGREEPRLNADAERTQQCVERLCESAESAHWLWGGGLLRGVHSGVSGGRVSRGCEDRSDGEPSEGQGKKARHDP